MDRHSAATVDRYDWMMGRMEWFRDTKKIFN
jgi:hypothetical protein